jgi:hypothetical protein
MQVFLFSFKSVLSASNYLLIELLINVIIVIIVIVLLVIGSPTLKYQFTLFLLRGGVYLLLVLLLVDGSHLIDNDPWILHQRPILKGLVLEQLAV